MALTAVKKESLTITPEVDSNGVLTGMVIITAEATDDPTPSLAGNWIPVSVRWDNTANPITSGTNFGEAFVVEFDRLRANQRNYNNLVDSIRTSLETTYAGVIITVE